jgi:hypothetical protein
MLQKVIVIAFFALLFTLSSLFAQADLAGNQIPDENQVANQVVQAKKVGDARVVFQLKQTRVPFDPKNVSEKAQIPQNNEQASQPRELTQREQNKLTQIQKAQSKVVQATAKPSKND